MNKGKRHPQRSTPFAVRLRVAMLSRYRYQCQFAIGMGVNEQLVSFYLLGRVTPTLGNIQKILQALPNVDARWLLTGDGTPPVRGLPNRVLRGARNLSPEVLCPVMTSTDSSGPTKSE